MNYSRMSINLTHDVERGHESGGRIIYSEPLMPIELPNRVPIVQPPLLSRWQACSNRNKGVLYAVVFFIVLYLYLLGDSVNEEDQQANESNFHTQTNPLKGSPVTVDGPLDTVNDDGTVSDIKVQLWVSHIDPFKKRVEAQVYFFPSPRIMNLERGGVNQKMLADFRFFNEVYERNTTMSAIPIVIPITSGNPYIYPFGTFRAEFDLKILKLPSRQLLPISVDIMASAPAIWFDVNRLETKTDPSDTNATSSNQQQSESSINNGFYSFEIIASRPKSIIMFSVFVVILLWALSWATVALTAAVYYSDYKPTAPYLGLGPALLFAMPNMRASQPGIPPIGVLIDVIGFIWNIALVSASSVVLIGIWIMRRNATKSI